MTPTSSKASFFASLDTNLNALREQGLYKPERVINSRQGAEVVCDDGRTLINLCANNYLGLSGEEKLVQASIDATKQYGYGLSSVRFICGTQTVHKQLEQALSRFLGMEDTILYAAAFDANGGLFEPLFDEQDAIISDTLNHASIIDGIRLCKAARFRYTHNDMTDLEIQLQAAGDKRHKVIVTDGVFSMDGTIAQLDKICDLADKYGALVMIDECHASGFMGSTGRGTHEHHHVMGRIDIITGTLGKALGGAMGGFTAARREVIETLRQKSRPYLFSNTLAPSIAGTSLTVLNMLSNSTELRDRLQANTEHFRREITQLGFTIKPGTHPIVPVMLFDAPIAQQFAQRLYALGILVTGFFYPVVPMGQARVRVQMSAAHSTQQLDLALAAFAQVGHELGLLKH
ncbi:glycine C-acetyltransferase [Glaciimonas sp. CA11.2]|uniref:glycine C-acetyltransferase n=1 Tax=unclassified Glaciimonas TaxID=2644401 RepID=UPI002AB3728C|nr:MULTISPECIES: glycine C-acetyltransferase [unclassified Glaciimonas]MDY7545561.1 glycine C-acetyltransferase [Glaciimonas sp. CA11.2]MEB0012752.1 glycine C-acetyltransferase [Glaciimonas sp. Cout2]MEB0082230.1 glycine C-acetyltransferase [Glaciimonas sp. Gout2]MEB0161897.1 glycine C-acetyltransferase [Glaciimonas sp. CA11.2]